MNELQIFRNDVFEVAIKQQSGECNFDAETVAKSLGITQKKNGTEYVRWERVNEYLKVSPQVGKGDFIPEAAVYKLAFKASNEVAEKFQDWLAIEVLPDIRKHGMYAKEELLDNPDLLLDVITRYKAEKEKNKLLDSENQLLAHQNVKWADRKVLEALVKAYGSVVGFEDAWREFKKELLYMHGINLNARVTNYLNDTGKKTKPRLLSMIADGELPSCVSTAVAMCKNKNVKIDSIISKYQS